MSHLGSGLCFITSSDLISSLLLQIYKTSASYIGLYYNETSLIYFSLFSPFSQSLYWMGPTDIKNFNIIKKIPLNHLNTEINTFVEKQINTKEDPYRELLSFLQFHKIENLLNINHDYFDDQLMNESAITAGVASEKLMNKELVDDVVIIDESMDLSCLIEEKINDIESNIINAFRRSLYNILMGYEPYSDLIGSLFDPKHIKYKEMIEKCLYSQNIFPLDEYQKLSLLHVRKQMHKFIKVDPKFDNYSKLLYYQLKNITDNIKKNETPTMNLNDLIKTANYFCPELDPIDEIDNSVSIGLLINPSVDIEKHINIKFKDNQKIVIAAQNPNLDIFTDEQLKEILLSLDIYAADDLAFNDVKRLIIQKLTNND